MKNTREFITLVNGMKHDALVRMFPVSERASAEINAAAGGLQAVRRPTPVHAGTKWRGKPASSRVNR